MDGHCISKVNGSNALVHLMTNHLNMKVLVQNDDDDDVDDDNDYNDNNNSTNSWFLRS